MLRCELCSFETLSSKIYVDHWRIHKNVHNVDFPCAFTNCRRRFASYNAFNCHVVRDHTYSKHNAISKNLSLNCSLPFCKNVFFADLPTLLLHIKKHINAGVKLECPYLNCSFSFTCKSSFTSHLSRYHRNWGIGELNPNYVSQSDLPVTDNEMCEPSDGDFQNNEIIPAPSRENFNKDLALFYLKLQAKKLVPVSTIQLINQEIQKINEYHIDLLLENLRLSLNSCSVSNFDIDKIICEMKENDVFSKCNSELLRSDYARKSFYKQHFNYVAPVDIYLGRNRHNRICSYQYIPICDSLQSVFKHKSVSDLVEENRCTKSENQFLKDVTDGSCFKENELFQQDSNALGIILFQDAFEVANPLGSAKKKHKIVGVYYTLSNLPPAYRSNVDNIQLVMLCLEVDLKYFGQEKMFRSLIEDLKKNEIEGILINNTFIKGAVCSVVGDNLGSHYIGGFMESFNCEYLCRYCLIKNSQFKVNPFSIGPIRTPSHYDTCITALAEGTTTSSDHGIKFNSVFNDLKYFHVCQPGLPPCLGHDLFEGIVAYDLVLYINYFCKVKKYFTYAKFNSILFGFNYKGTDCRNKPNEMNGKSEKLNGHAAQNWCLLRLLPVLIGYLIKDYEDSVWDLCLQLRSLVEIICAPKIQKGQIAYLQTLIEEYLDLRSSLFPSVALRPKHHYLSHYTTLILQFGPLIRLWTLRFESKHSYFKRCARSCNNFKNICSSLATKHQLLQTYINAGNIFSHDIQINKGTKFHASMYHEKIQSSLFNNFTSTNTLVSYNVSVRGIAYKKGNVLPLRENEWGIIFGKILLILVNDKTVYFVVKTSQFILMSHLGVYADEITSDISDSEIICVSIDELLDYYSLPVYKIKHLSCVCLHHAVV
ncbi:uncharacterized protein LOC129235069 [Uloborus diversus]|uniref:uncharacterized protein LOC129235069 n=1 Tax=Uloborus diversus TaxID=327109 RepID=UPI002409E247|nr:uncharacterized protein LOC129235069 [Uloborus diversus]